ncbi:MAG TPA: DUF4412 domain-containing protein [Bacteroidia bacterium]|nr:DUF4412 domain-containing protein [Bacteroidia bacterium]
MKKISAFLLLTTLTASSALYTGCNSNGTSSSGSNFQGIVTYEIKAGAGLPPEVSAMLQSMKMTTYVKGNFTRTEESMEGNNTTVIADSKKPDDPIMLISMFHQKYAIMRNDSMKKLEQNNIPKIEYIDSASATKSIAGYSCKKAKVTVNMGKEGSVPSYVYYTTDLPYADPQGQFKGLKGMPMEFSVSMQGLNLTITAKSVESKTLSDSLFTIPADYKQMDINDVQKDLEKHIPKDTTGGGGGMN